MPGTNEVADGAAGAPATEPEFTEGAGVDWEGLNSDVAPGQDDENADEAVNLPAESTDPAQPTVDDPPVVKPTNETKPVLPVDAPVEQAKPQQTPEEAVASQAKLAEDFAKWEQAQIDTLTKDYSFDEDTASRLQTEPEAVLPGLAAKMHMQVMKQVLETVSRMMPQMVAPELERTSTESKATDFFYGLNNDLNPAHHHAQVLEAGKLFRKMNPKATAEEAAKGIGDIVRLTANIKTQPKAQVVASKPTPHRPVAAGSKVAPAKAPAQKTTWDELADED